MFVSLFRRLSRKSETSRGRSAARSRRFVPQLTALEDRNLPSTFTVLNNLDSGDGSLRQAVLDANDAPGQDTIVFAKPVHNITLTSGELTVTDSLNILGPGANKLTISGNDASRVFAIDASSGAVTISGLTVTRGLANGSASGSPSTGGGVLNYAALTLANVVVANNRAVGDAAVTVTLNPVVNGVGVASGGGVANFGQLSVFGGVFTGNEVVGADNADSSGSSFPGPAFAGNALGGGGLANLNTGTASIVGSTFTFNTARAGNGGMGDFAGIAGGGAILNDSVMTITGSTFRHNQALGGSNNVSPFHNGHALGGAIMTGSLKPVGGGTGGSIDISDSTFDHNRAVGGDDNTVTLPLASVPPADGPNNGYGGAILVFQGNFTLHDTVVRHNQAIGGTGGAEQNGSLGVGGGIFLFNFLGGVTSDISDSSITHNEAIGGAGRAGGNGGDGLGGGIAAGGLGAPFGAPGMAMIHNTTVDHNRAQGGMGGTGGDGGDGLGGGVFNGADSALTFADSQITSNLAKRGTGKGGGSAGDGIGGGVYDLGAFVDFMSVIRRNRADTSHDNIFP